MFSAKHLNVGQEGEKMACDFLKEKGYKILTQNYRKKWGEIDIVSQSKDKTLVFIEVKTFKEFRQSETGKNYSLKPEDNLTKSKLKKLEKTCLSFANHYPDLIDERRGWRIDLVTILIRQEESPPLTKRGESYFIKHYENISIWS